jgi:hypothetical protein
MKRILKSHPVNVNPYIPPKDARIGYNPCEQWWAIDSCTFLGLLLTIFVGLLGALQQIPAKSW